MPENLSKLLAPKNLARTRADLLTARHIDGGFYNSPEVQALEKERIFMREWLVLARVGEARDALSLDADHVGHAFVQPRIT